MCSSDLTDKEKSTMNQVIKMLGRVMSEAVSTSRGRPVGSGLYGMPKGWYLEGYLGCSTAWYLKGYDWKQGRASSYEAYTSMVENSSYGYYDYDTGRNYGTLCDLEDFDYDIAGNLGRNYGEF